LVVTEITKLTNSTKDIFVRECVLMPRHRHEYLWESVGEISDSRSLDNSWIVNFAPNHYMILRYRPAGDVAVDMASMHDVFLDIKLVVVPAHASRADINYGNVVLIRYSVDRDGYLQLPKAGPIHSLAASAQAMSVYVRYTD
jgi:hypothetical protein